METPLLSLGFDKIKANGEKMTGSLGEPEGAVLKKKEKQKSA
ncbi:hypothetical protein NCCP2222_31240 [Sporosarcina sp. NCCP-2222]|nr:hypothetical protein [Sporosarcina sp. NCCP-2222]GKV57177.1 hypothetical protein NCCP2222_31240 [Sporosarcina sp. NCCP-2222]